MILKQLQTLYWKRFLVNDSQNWEARGSTWTNTDILPTSFCILPVPLEFIPDPDVHSAIFAKLPSLKMDTLRMLLALPEPGYDPSGKTAGEIRVDAFLRKRKSPLWRFIHWCRELDSRVPRVLRRLRDCIWAGMFLEVLAMQNSSLTGYHQRLWAASFTSKSTAVGRRR